MEFFNTLWHVLTTPVYYSVFLVIIVGGLGTIVINKNWLYSWGIIIGSLANGIFSILRDLGF